MGQIARLLGAAAFFVSACGDGGGPTAPPYTAKARLSQVGLYRDIAGKQLAEGAIPFTPAYPLWSDGAAKERVLMLPEGAAIDTTDVDHWTFPVGTRLFKEFSLDGRRLETRLIERFGPGPDDFAMLTYAWLEDESDALLLEAGAEDVRGTHHDIPESAACADCHGGEPGRILGFSAVQLSHPAGREVIARLADRQALPAAVAEGYSVPGSGLVQQALGYMHANCGSCHNARGFAYEETELTLRLSTGELEPEDTLTYATSIDVGLDSWRTFDYSLVVDPGSPDSSGLLARMLLRDEEAMPPLATEIVDGDAVSLIRDWIAGLPATPDP